MSVSDPIADMLTRIRNAVKVGHKSVSFPSSKIKLEIANILKSEGFVSGFKLEEEDSTKPNVSVSLHYWNKDEPAINGLKRVSKPGLRIYVNKNEILNNFRRRIKNEINLEFNEAKGQVKKIATFRLNEIIN